MAARRAAELGPASRKRRYERRLAVGVCLAVLRGPACRTSASPRRGKARTGQVRPAGQSTAASRRGSVGDDLDRFVLLVQSGRPDSFALGIDSQRGRAPTPALPGLGDHHPQKERESEKDDGRQQIRPPKRWIPIIVPRIPANRSADQRSDDSEHHPPAPDEKADYRRCKPKGEQWNVRHLRIDVLKCKSRRRRHRHRERSE